MNINGKRIILTGASSGIGKELLMELAQYNAQIIAVGRNADKIPKINDRVKPYSCDVSRKENVDMLFQYALETLGGIDIFIANAGFAYCEELLSPDWKHIEEIYATNVTSPIYSFEKMKSINAGREYTVVITCSAVSKVALPGYSLYCSTKAAINSFADVYRYEKNDEGHLSLVYPIATSTNFFLNAANQAPVPWPVQSADIVARHIVKGIEKEKRRINPSKTFIVLEKLNAILPFLCHIYSKIHAEKFKKWVQLKQG
jgi:short-subunit dehydrogenase